MPTVDYSTLDYTISGIAYSTYLTGIAGSNIVGMYVTTGDIDNGFIYDETTGEFISLDYPGAVSTVPYGPTSGSAASGIVVVGSYKLSGENTDNGFIYDASQPVGSQWLTIDMPGATDTIPHSTYGEYVVGNYDNLATANNDYAVYPSGGNAFIYDIATGLFTTNDMPGAISTTAYGIWDGAIAGGYTALSNGVQVTQGYIYDTSTGIWHSYAHPGAEVTHFDGITAGKTAGSYVLTGDYVALGASANSPEQGFTVTVTDWVAAGWTDLSVPGSAATSGNSGYGDTAVGVYTTNGSDLIQGYVATLPCFAAGSMIATPDGPVAVEQLAPGMIVESLFGGAQPVRWVGHRRVDCRRHPNPAAVWPVRVCQHAFGLNQPSRDLYLSPDHAIFVGEVLIPVKYLIDGDAVRQVPRDRVTYYHVELDQHDVLSVEGLAAESLLPQADRSAFENGGGVMQIHPDFSHLHWDVAGCAPLVVTGPAVTAARATLARFRAHAAA
ncbi:MAG TPA: Hint domain-containing protein [Acidisoma sp.]|jgi:hypothetical protein|nr:Hint domain-containing protein [Acidisoma sp.]